MPADKQIVTVGDLRELLKHSEDEEPLDLLLERGAGFAGTRTTKLKCTGATSTAGGRATILWFKKRW